jgi:hypothetical protein
VAEFDIDGEIDAARVTVAVRLQLLDALEVEVPVFERVKERAEKMQGIENTV